MNRILDGEIVNIFEEEGERIMKISLKKTVTAAMLAALTVALSGFYIPIGVSNAIPSSIW